MSWTWLLPAATLAAVSAGTLGRLRALEREQARLAHSVAAVGALAAAHQDLRRALVPDPSGGVGEPMGSGTVGNPPK